VLAFLLGILLAAAAIVALLEFRGAIAGTLSDLESIAALQSARSRVLADVVDVETGYRGFLLSRREEALEPLTMGVASTPSDIATLRAGGGVDASLGPTIESYASASRAAIDEMNQAVAAQRRAPANEQADASRMFAIKKQVDYTRQLSGDLERMLRHQSEEIRSTLQANTSRVILAIAALLAGVALVSFTQVRELLALGRRYFNVQTDSRAKIATLSHTLTESREALDTLNRRLVLAMRSAHVVVFSIEQSGRITWMNDGGSGMFGREALPWGLADFAPPDDRARIQNLVANAPANQDLVDFEMRIETGDLSHRWLKITLAPVRSQEGNGFLGSAVDITNIKRREEGNVLLMRELSHRSKNLLAIVQAMARQTAKATASPAEFYDRFGSRLRALAAGHDLLVKAAYSGAEMSELLQSQIGPLGAAMGSRVVSKGPMLMLRPEAAQNLGMAFHELAINAQIHGALTTPLGRVEINWKIEQKVGETQLMVDWIESGGPIAPTTERRGFGSTLILENLPRSLHGTVTLEHLAGGSRCHMELPMKYIVENFGENDVKEENVEPPALRDVG